MAKNNSSNLTNDDQEFLSQYEGGADVGSGEVTYYKDDSGKVHAREASTAYLRNDVQNTVSSQEAAQYAQEQRNDEVWKEAFGDGAISKTLSGTMGLASGLTMGMSTDAIIKGADLVGQEDGQAARAFFRGAESVNPYTYKGAQAAGFIAPMLTGAGEVEGAAKGAAGALAEGAGALAKGAALTPAGLLPEAAGALERGMLRYAAGESPGALAKATGAILRGGAEGAIYGAAGGIEEDLIKDRPLTAASILSHAEGGALFGAGIGALGAGFGTLASKGSRAIAETMETKTSKLAEQLAVAKEAELKIAAEKQAYEQAVALRNEAKGTFAERQAAIQQRMAEAEQRMAESKKLLASGNERLQAGAEARFQQAQAEYAELAGKAKMEHEALVSAKSEELLQQKLAVMNPQERAMYELENELGLSPKWSKNTADATLRAQGRGAYAGGAEEVLAKTKKYMQEELGVANLKNLSMDEVVQLNIKNKSAMNASHRLSVNASKSFSSKAAEFAPRAEELDSLFADVVERHFGNTSGLSELADREAQSLAKEALNMNSLLEKAKSEGGWNAVEELSKTLGSQGDAFYTGIQNGTLKASKEAQAKAYAFQSSFKFELDRLMEQKMASAAVGNPGLAADREAYIAAKKAFSLGAAMDTELKGLAKKLGTSAKTAVKDSISEAMASVGKFKAPSKPKTGKAAIREAMAADPELSQATASLKSGKEELSALRAEMRQARAGIPSAPSRTSLTEAENTLKESTSGGAFGLDASDSMPIVYGALYGNPVGAVAALAVKKAAQGMADVFSNSVSGLERRLKMAEMVQKTTEMVDSGVQKFMTSKAKPSASAFFLRRSGPEEGEKEVLHTLDKLSAERDSQAAQWARKVTDNDHRLIEQMMKTREAAREYLNKIAPKSVTSEGDLKAPGKSKLTPYEMHRFLTASRAIQEPLEVFQAISQGDVNRDAIEAVVKVYPPLADLMRSQVQRSVLELKSKGEFLSLQKITQLSFALGVPVDSVMNPQFIKARAEDNKAIREAEAKQEKSSSDGQGRAPTSFSTASERTQQ